MLAIELPITSYETGQRLEQLSPEEIAIVEGRSLDGTLTHWSLLLSAAAIAIPEVRKIVLSLIKAKEHHSITYKGIKLQGYSAREVGRILREIQATRERK